MASRIASASIAISSALCALVGIAAAIPSTAFPFNSQVPAVARVDAPYNFQISDSTFAPTSTNLTYSLSNQPAWLAIDSATRTLTGTPGQQDVGSSGFTLTAADNNGAAHMECTLVVSQDKAPRISGDVSKQLAATANLSSSHPPVVTLLPSTVFKFDFQQESFIDYVQRKLFYYATLSDHTPLPSWLKFDSNLLTFSGTAPSLSAFPQSWNIELIASDVPGFSATTASFTIAIGTEQLAFVPEEQDLNVTAGRQIKFTSLQDQLFRNSERLPSTDWESAEVASLPFWLNFDSSTLAVEGDVPDDMEQQNFSVTVTDLLGNSATAVINLIPNNASLFGGQVGTVVAEAGKTLHYQFEDSLFSESGLDLSVELPTSAQWLHFDADTNELAGTVPSSAEAAAVQVTLTAKPSDGGEGQSQVFTIDIKAVKTTPTSSELTTRTSPTNSSTTTPGIGLARERPSSYLSGGVIAVIVVLSLLGAALLIACLIWCCRRRRRRAYERKSPTPSQMPISRPIAPPEAGDTITVTTELHRDVEKSAGSDDEHESIPPPPKIVEPPPKLSVDLPSKYANRKSKWSKRFSRMSYASSIGQGDAAIRADSNIPEWGQDVSAFHTPHDSFSVSTEMARNSRHLSQTSPLKSALKNREKHRYSDTIGGLGIYSNATGGLARHSSKRVDKHRRGRSSFGGLSTTREASSIASITTARTSVLSTKPSDFPPPPQSENSTSFSAPAPSVLTADTLRDPKRRSIRIVQRSDSVADNRPADEKRESYIRKRAIAKNDSRASVQSPLFANGSRQSSIHKRQNSRSAMNLLNGSVRYSRRSKNGKSMLATYSESSSLEPRPDDPRRSTTRESKRLSQRLKSSFGRDFPRVVSRSTLDDGDSENWTTESSLNSDEWSDDACKPLGHGRNSWRVNTPMEKDEEDFRDELAKPRNERDWRYPAEASPTPPPAPPRSRHQSASRQSTPGAESGAPRQSWRERLHDKSSSPLSSNVQVIEPTSISPTGKTSQHQNRLSEPISLVSADSMHKGRPRVGHTKSRRPVSVEEVQRLSSMKAEQDAATIAGSERWEDEDELKGAGLVPRMESGRVGTQKSDMSGPAFL